MIRSFPALANHNRHEWCKSGLFCERLALQVLGIDKPKSITIDAATPPPPL